MSTLKVNTIQDRVGGNQSTASEIAQGRAKAWVEFSGQGSASIIGSYNVSSVSRASNGNYQVNFSSNFSNTNYVAVISFDGELFDTSFSTSASSLTVVHYGQWGDPGFSGVCTKDPYSKKPSFTFMVLN